MNAPLTRRHFIGSASAFLGALPFWSAAAETPRLRFGVISDIHIGGRKEAPARLAFALKWLDAHQVDAVLSPGDIAHHGFVWQLEKFAALWQTQFPDGRAKDGRKVELMISTGNHDAWEGKGRLFDGDTTARTWKRLFNETFEPVWRKEVKGYTFIGAQWPTYKPDLEAYMARVGPTLDRTKPFFFCQHEHPQNTCHGTYGRSANDKGQAVRALSPYPNAVAFSGHSHCALTDERTVWQGAFTSIGAGCLHEGAPALDGAVNASAFWHGPSRARNLMAPVNDREAAWGGDPDGGGFLYVEVFDGFLVIERRSSVSDCALGPAWTVRVPEKADGPFNFGRQIAARRAAEFPAGAAVTVTDCPNGHPLESKWRAGEPCVAVDFPAARPVDGTRVFTYGVRIKSGARTIATARLYAPDFALPESLPPRPGCCLFPRKDIPLGEPLTVEITPRTCFGHAGRTLVLSPGADVAPSSPGFLL